MLAEWIRSGLDLILIFLVGVGLVQATRLIWHLAGLRASRVEMEHFVRDFNATVLRAEAGIKGLKMAARESGDDLERLVDKSLMVRDELQFIVESADMLAERLTQAASSVVRPDAKVSEAKATPVKADPLVAPAEMKVEAKPAPKPEVKVAEAPKPAPAAPPAPIALPTVTPLAVRREPEPKPSSRAEKELMQALQKLN